ncbi:hypothetical protein TIFTF001_002867 [Ficus carica]|uniref:Uncharacterized protein n=1 Tax=Ficus carica TaxID=3494 RepID=A0AA87Z8N4_FICCA|nr:hypothetical protein TIFTF001_002867 [Ficus carica]
MSLCCGFNSGPIRVAGSIRVKFVLVRVAGQVRVACHDFASKSGSDNLELRSRLPFVIWDLRPQGLRRTLGRRRDVFQCDILRSNSDGR